MIAYPLITRVAKVFGGIFEGIFKNRKAQTKH
jgi:hypothetical protein